MFRYIDELRKRVFGCWRARRLASRPEPVTTAGAAFCAVPGADPPHEGPTVAVRLPSSLGFMFYLISTDREMGLLLVLFCCAAVVRRCGGPIILGDSSRVGEFNSRLLRGEFPVRGVREFAGKRLICRTVFAAKRRLSGENRRNSRLGGKNREFCP